MKPGNDKEAPGTGGTEGKAMTSYPKVTRETGLEQVTIEEHADFIQLQSDRLEALRIIKGIAGTVRSFLEIRQPALGDRTGRELLENEPTELLRRLRELERPDR